MNLQKLYIFFALCGLVLNVFGQNKKLDSLFTVLKITKEDTIKINTLNTLACEFRSNNSDTAIYLANQALILSQKIDYKMGMADAYLWGGTAVNTLGKFEEAIKQLTKAKNIYEQLLTTGAKNILKIKKHLASSCNNIGNVYLNQGNYGKAVENYLVSLKIREEIGDKNSIAASYNNIGMVYDYQGNYPKALENYFFSLKIREEIADKPGIAGNYNNIGIIYSIQGNYQKALENYFASLKIRKEIGDKRGIAGCFNNIGSVYRNQRNYPKALENQLASLKINQEIGDKKGTSVCYNNIVSVYLSQGDYSKALKNSFVPLKISEEIGYKEGIDDAYINIGIANTKLNHFPLAMEYLIKALLLSKEIGSKDYIKESYKGLAEADSASGDYKQAFSDYKQYIIYRDSLFNEENIKKTVQAQMQYDFDKKETIAKEEQEKKDLANTEQRKQQRTIIFSVITGLILVLLFSTFLYRRFKVTQKQNMVIQQQKQEVEKQRELADSRRIIAEEQKQVIEKQKHLVEEHQKEIVDSITYAKRLQQAILPSNEEITKHFADNFLLYKPKDIVAGDFYWMEHLDEVIFIAVADSTGHGVPGAMVSVVCSNALNRAVKEFGLRDTGKILDKTRELVLETFTKSSSDVKDGMDISLLSVNNSTRQIQWSGANNQLWYIENFELKEIKADKQPIGKTENPTPFTTHDIICKPNTIFYLMTDGYADQFGGLKGKKFMYKQLEKKLIEICYKPLKEQNEILSNTFEEWKDNLEQIDDVTMIGIKI